MNLLSGYTVYGIIRTEGSAPYSRLESGSTPENRSDFPPPEEINYAPLIRLYGRHWKTWKAVHKGSS
ncbi:hypothetical protein TRIP_B50202 [uncultured Desulfatiglans sp.]|nr:hypothetical protein TRIP_B50202 [uncultured Desulfatiglans sp.]